MEKKITSIRAMIQEHVKALREKQTVKPAVSAEKKLLIQSHMKELLEKAKQASMENKGTKTVPVSFREKTLARIEEIKKQKLNKKEVKQ
jgi:hypothetical protein